MDEPLVFDCGGDRLLGVLSRAEGAGTLGVVVVVGGPQYRAGSHRHFVTLARALAAAGYPTLRFDYRGMGDSEGAPRSFEEVDDDIAAAIGALHAAVPQLNGVMLWGLCDGAAAALLYLDRTQDPRVRGLCLLNPWVRSAATLARAQVRHYYWRRLRERSFWAKLFSGRVAAAAVRDLVANVRLSRRAGRSEQTALSFRARMARAWPGFDGPILLQLSDDDTTAREFVETVQADPAWRGAFERAGLVRHDLAGADHTLSTAGAKKLAATQTLAWLTRQKS